MTGGIGLFRLPLHSPLLGGA